MFRSEGEARRRMKEEQDKLEKPKIEGRGMNCPKCMSWIPYAGDKTVCKACGWKMKP